MTTKHQRCPTCEKLIVPVVEDDAEDFTTDHVLMTDMDGDVILTCPYACPHCGTTGYDHNSVCRRCGFDVNAIAKRIGERARR